MTTQLYLLKIGEIALKGGNRQMFENQLKKNIRFRLKKHLVSYTGQRGRFFAEIEGMSENEVTERLSQIFGLSGFALCTKTEKSTETVTAAAEAVAADYLAEHASQSIVRFKVESRRADKAFPYDSYKLNCLIGDALCACFPQLKVDVRTPELTINIEIRDHAYVYGNDIAGPGGLPVGCAGRGILLLSGGIDSPVAGYLMSKRGLKLDAVYFHTYPYTSGDSLEKVKTLSKLLSPYTSGLNLFCVNFTEIQLKIKAEGKPNRTTILSRSAMMKIADRLAPTRDAGALVTGEALSQVASQTVETLRITGSHTVLPVLRPVIGFDKQEIIRIAEKIGTYETSILPYDDCCTLFSPEHPEIKPDFEELRNDFDKLNLDAMITEAVESAERIYFHPDTDQ
ncbi:MAG: tRNA uracil 4-sulfurtransferase ThiI [Spirochaetia bacterium]|nr:tRNA uracil 4-sulfurtransferase ThiI [Spirochaetia bacterium]